MGTVNGLAVHVDGLKELRREAEKFDPAARKHLAATMREVAAPLVPIAQARMPRVTGKLASTIRVYGGVSGALIGSSHPGVPVIEFAYKGGYSTLTKRWGPAPRTLIPVVKEAEPTIVRAVETSIQRFADANLHGAEGTSGKGA